ncbi:MAG: hypothetical protein UW43_C0001G0049 [Candidatus Yanofskybacteria bacterium GW2011_GWA1_44_21]|uniref:Probable lipid II flippase MurJ n=2 Tax=Candidatus Yanofskyibacteriota TaxID=1752733 RepID=A0A1F8H1K7_9BACT|nr:MAG: hypothetical protein UW14_C0006G0041 [Candidatus Yanofskybacteria bacterium GW2011_GWA2_44_10]KKT50884.1 MAG: hypothetical protein UW43_C0001G0049 [Candidatus Yanofskybacteria bacterium GW2011_GWA1_44_21]KKT90456.1 MAG: hypothetical protein UW90_C0001G0044 [Candidatus Yanofskybacteria bacterium GW2011_GWB1_45_11]OGN03110.1 MAG: murein biosynthesis integral membrane protein MurJ [Candidatus Yanofskybacteria bacterium RIFCSPHIGHO2_01_FULL_44_110b]OGN14263.1 MAG: murein biosynthesis integr
MFKSKIFRAGALLAFFTIIGKLIGLYRDRILAGQFGASSELDVYYAAFRIPDLIFNLFILGATSSAIVPIFLEYYHKEISTAWRAAQNFLNVMAAGILAVSVVVMIFAEPLAGLIGPGFTSSQAHVLAMLIRIMLISSIIFAVSTILGSILQALQRFLVYSLASIFYNLGIIVGAIWFVPLFESWGYLGIYGLGFGVVLGALLHLLIQLPVAWRAGFRFTLLFDIYDGAFRRMISLMLPRTLALGAYNIGLVVITSIASLLGSGSITILNLATNLQFVPISIVGISLATAVFPQLSTHAAKNELLEFKKKLNHALWLTLVFTGLLAVAIFIFRNIIVDAIFKVGQFKDADRALTASVVGIFMFSAVSQSLMHVVTRAYYSFQNTKTPFWVSVFAIALNVALSYILGLKFDMGVRGIAVATAIAYNIHFILLLIIFNTKYRLY